MLDLATAGLPPGFWDYIKRVNVTACYASVFGEYWEVAVQLGSTKSEWRAVSDCPPQPLNVSF